MGTNGQTTGRFRFLWVAQPLQALGEAWLLGLFILFLLSRLVGRVSPFVLTNGLLFLCGVCGMWTVLRVRMPQGRLLRRVIWEGAVGVALSLVMAVGLRVPARLFGWEGVWRGASLGDLAIVTLLL
ncbi:hypothetical protein ACFLYD_03775, partial [Chloroflexota bacterium]